MYMSRFGVKNYKCLGEIDIPLTPIHVLIGENDAGKTSLLEAMEAFCASSEKPLPEVFPVFPTPWSGRELVRHSAPEPQVELRGEWERTDEVYAHEHRRYGFTVDFPTQGNGCSIGDEWIQVGPEKKPLRTANTPSDRTALSSVRSGISVPSRPTLTVTLGTKGDLGRAESEHGKGESEHEAICNSLAFIRPAHRYSFDPWMMVLPAAMDPDMKLHLEPDGFGLTTLLGDILDHDAERFVQLSREYCGFFPQFSRVRLETEKGFKWEAGAEGFSVLNQAGVGKAIRLDMHGNQSIRARQASDGAILFLGFLALAYLPNPPNLLLIEEPENGIYPGRLEKVLKLLKQLVTRTEDVPFPQIIMTTHSPYVLSHFEPEEVTFLSRPPGEPDGPVRARPMRDAPNIRERLADGFYLGELWYNVSEEDLFGDS